MPTLNEFLGKFLNEAALKDLTSFRNSIPRQLVLHNKVLSDHGFVRIPGKTNAIMDPGQNNVHIEHTYQHPVHKDTVKIHASLTKSATGGWDSKYGYEHAPGEHHPVNVKSVVAPRGTNKGQEAQQLDFSIRKAKGTYKAHEHGQLHAPASQMKPEVKQTFPQVVRPHALPLLTNPIPQRKPRRA